jgi:hypothetical protein
MGNLKSEQRFEEASVTPLGGARVIDRDARDIAAEVLRSFMEGSISNVEYERRYPRSKDDLALWEIHFQVWFFYSDIRTHKLTGKYALNVEGRAFLERCIVFLKSNAQFEWPRQKFRPWRVILRVLGLGRTVKRWEQQEMSIGDQDVWPFINKADYEEAASAGGRIGGTR